MKNLVEAQEKIENENNIEDEKRDYLKEFAELVQNPFYADGSEHIDEIRNFAETQGVSLKTAYNALFAEQKYEQIRQKAEIDAQNKINCKQSRKIEAIDSGNGLAKKAVKLNADQLYIASACGMTPEEYAKFM